MTKRTLTRAQLDTLLDKHHLDACEPALDWLAEHPELTPAEAWAQCPRADWLAWLVDETLDERTRRLLACDYAEAALPAFEAWAPDDSRVKDCIATVRRHAEGKATDDELAAAAAAARAAAWAARAAAWWAAAAAWAAALGAITHKRISWAEVEARLLEMIDD